MKTTNKIVLASIAGIVLILLVLLIAARVMVGTITEQSSAVSLSGERVERELDVKAFDAVELRGGFDAEITLGDDRRLRVEGDSALVEMLDVRVSGGTLLLDAARPSVFGRDGVRVEIAARELIRLKSDGGASIALVNVVSEELSVESNGAADIESSGGRIGRLELRSSGAGNFDFRDTPTVDAEVVLNGVGSVMLQMAGGVLSGEINGAGSVEFSGEVSDRRIRVSGVGSVERR